MAILIYDDNIIHEGPLSECETELHATMKQISEDGTDMGNPVEFADMGDHFWQGQDQLYGAIYNLSISDLD